MEKDISNLSPLEKSIIEEAVREFTAKGYHTASVDDMAAHLAIGKGTIYRHFGNKIMLFMAAISYIMDQASRLVSTVLEIPQFPANLERYIDIILKMNQEVGNFIFTIMPSDNSIDVQAELRKNSVAQKVYSTLLNRREEALKTLETILRNARDNGQINTRGSLAIQAEIIYAAINNFMRAFYSNCRDHQDMGVCLKFTLEEGVQELKDFIIRGIGANPA